MVSREPFIIRKSFYTLNALESAGSIKRFIYFIAKKCLEMPQKWQSKKKLSPSFQEVAITQKWLKVKS